MPKSINVSPVSYAAWLRLIFDHPTEEGQWFWRDGVEFHVSSKTRLVEHVTRLCREFKAVVAAYSLPQINDGIWLLLSARLEFGKYLADAEVPFEKRLKCVRSMFWVYADFVAVSDVELMENCFDMWWDLVCSDFWNAHLWRIKGDEIMAQMWREDEEESAALSPEARAWQEQVSQILSQLQPGEEADARLQAHGLSFNDFPQENRRRPSHEIDITFGELEPSEQQIMDAMLATLTQILALNDERCESYALHGLNHLPHPQRAAAVQAFIDVHSQDWDEPALKWVESCRDGKAM